MNAPERIWLTPEYTGSIGIGGPRNPTQIEYISKATHEKELREAFEAGFRFSESIPDYENGETISGAFAAFLKSKEKK